MKPFFRNLWDYDEPGENHYAEYVSCQTKKSKYYHQDGEKNGKLQIQLC